MNKKNNKKIEEKVSTLCIVHKHPKVLLGFKKRGFGAGRYNGFGGKVKSGESVEKAALRELKEESSLDVVEIKKLGELFFEFQDSGDKLKVYVFKITDFKGEVRESEEMKPQWFFVDEIPFGDMWADDVYWMPLFLQNKKFTGHFVFKDENNLIFSSIKTI